MKFNNNFFVYILASLIILCVGYAYFRFMIVQDYMVAYQGVCDPAVHSCFVNCNNDACTDKQYYAKVQKYDADLSAQCGKDITNCDAANACLPQSDQKCSITYCDSTLDGSTCSTPNGGLSSTTKDFNP